MLGKRLNKKIGIYFLGMLSSKIFPVLLIPIYAFYVFPKDFGYYDFAYTVMGIAIPFLYIAIWEAILRFILSEENEKTKRTAAATSAFFSLFITFILILGSVIYAFVSENENVLLIVIMYGSHALALIWQYYARAFEESYTYVFAGIIGTIVNFISVLILIVMFNLGLNGLLISYILGQFAVFVFIELKIKVRRSIRVENFNVSTLKKMLLYSSPLVLNLTSTWLMSAYGRLIITVKLGAEANGMFAFSSNFSLIISMLGSVVTMAVIEEAIISAKKQGFDSGFTKTIESIFKIFLSIAMIALPLIIIFYAFIKDTDYYTSLKLTPWQLIYAVTVTLSSTIGAIFQAIDMTKYQFITTVAGAVVTVVVSTVLIDNIGIYAVIIGQVMGAITMLLSRYALVNKFIEFKINWNPVINMTGLYLLFTMFTINSHYLVSIIIFPIIIAFVCYINWENIRPGYQLLKKKLYKK